MPKPKHTQKTVHFSVFVETYEKLQVSGSELAKALGYAPTSWFHWRTAQTIPAPAALGCECLLRRQRKDRSTEPVTMFLLRVPEKHMLAFQAFTSALDGIERTPIAPPNKG